MIATARECEGVVDDAVVGPFAALFAGDEAGVDELLHVVRDGRLGESDGLGEVADAGFAVVVRGDERQQSDSGGIAERLEYAGELLGGVGVEDACR